MRWVSDIVSNNLQLIVTASHAALLDDPRSSSGSDYRKGNVFTWFDGKNGFVRNP